MSAAELNADVRAWSKSLSRVRYFGLSYETMAESVDWDFGDWHGAEQPWMTPRPRSSYLRARYDDPATGQFIRRDPCLRLDQEPALPGLRRGAVWFEISV